DSKQLASLDGTYGSFQIGILRSTSYVLIEGIDGLNLAKHTQLGRLNENLLR
ncbi:5428_t:CDS:1, partial [Gigaspora rosea]